MHPLGLRILVALGVPAAVTGCPPAREGAGPTKAVDAAPSTDVVAIDDAATAVAEASTAEVSSSAGGADATPAVDAPVAVADAAVKPPTTFVQYKPPIAPPNYCPQLATAQCLALADAQAAAVPGTKAKGCPPAMREPCPCHPANAMGCQPGSQCQVGHLPDVTAAERKKGKADTCCYETQEVCVPPWVGRALRAMDEVDVLAPVVLRDDWSVGRVPAERAARARFLRAALGEHAAVASFAFTSLALLAHGAPADLVEATHRAALDEIEHARLMFGLAGGAGVGPGPLPLPPLLVPDLSELVVSTFRDACLQETVGAVAVRAEAEAEADPAIAAVLARVADDEERHAVLAYRTLAWALGAAGAPGQAALERELSRLGDPPESALVRDLVVPCARAALAAAQAALPSPS